jgi:hypothetical protein
MDLIESTQPQSPEFGMSEAKSEAPPLASERGPGLRSRKLPATNIHPIVAIIGAACYAWIMVVAWQVFDHGTTMLALVISAGIFLMMIGLPLRLVSMARNMQPERKTDRDFEAFLEGEVDTYTGRMPGRQAFVEILLPPAALALAATAFCLIVSPYT